MKNSKRLPIAIVISSLFFVCAKAFAASPSAPAQAGAVFGCSYNARSNMVRDAEGVFVNNMVGNGIPAHMKTDRAVAFATRVMAADTCQLEMKDLGVTRTYQIKMGAQPEIFESTAGFPKKPCQFYDEYYKKYLGQCKLPPPLSKRTVGLVDDCRPLQPDLNLAKYNCRPTSRYTVRSAAIFKMKFCGDTSDNRICAVKMAASVPEQGAPTAPVAGPAPQAPNATRVRLPQPSAQ